METTDSTTTETCIPIFGTGGRVHENRESHTGNIHISNVIRINSEKQLQKCTTVLLLSHPSHRHNGLRWGCLFVCLFSPLVNLARFDNGGITHGGSLDSNDTSRHVLTMVASRMVALLTAMILHGTF